MAPHDDSTEQGPTRAASGLSWQRTWHLPTSRPSTHSRSCSDVVLPRVVLWWQDEMDMDISDGEESYANQPPPPPPNSINPRRPSAASASGASSSGGEGGKVVKATSWEMLKKGGAARSGSHRDRNGDAVEGWVRGREQPDREGEAAGGLTEHAAVSCWCVCVVGAARRR